MNSPGLETGATSPWLHHALKKADLPTVLMDARHAHAALSMRPTKSDRSDARGLAEMVRMGWYRAVTAKSFTSHERLALLAARRRLVTIRVDLDGQIRGLLKTFGLILGPGNTDALIRRAEALAEAILPSVAWWPSSLRCAAMWSNRSPRWTAIFAAWYAASPSSSGS